jgi:hypothetical protein
MRRFTFTIGLLAGGICTLLSLTTRAVPAADRAEPTHVVNCRLIYQSDDGTAKVLWVPELRQVDGGEMLWFQGEEMLVSMGEDEHAIPVAEQVRVRVHRVKNGRLRVFVTLSRSTVEDQDAQRPRPSDFIVQESTVRKVQTVRHGEVMTVSLDKRMKLEIVVMPCEVRV